MVWKSSMDQSSAFTWRPVGKCNRYPLKLIALRSVGPVLLCNGEENLISCRVTQVNINSVLYLRSSASWLFHRLCTAVRLPSFFRQSTVLNDSVLWKFECLNSKYMYISGCRYPLWPWNLKVIHASASNRLCTMGYAGSVHFRANWKGIVTWIEFLTR